MLQFMWRLLIATAIPLLRIRFLPSHVGVKSVLSLYFFLYSNIKKITKLGRLEFMLLCRRCKSSLIPHFYCIADHRFLTTVSDTVSETRAMHNPGHRNSQRIVPEMRLILSSIGRL